jgi:flagellum-specific peptidoglycan hydrolase FlgJ
VTSGWSGAIPCGAGTIANYACFSGFQDSANGAFASRQGSLIESMLAQDPAVAAITVFQAVQAMPGAAWAEDPNYAQKVSSAIRGVTADVLCLQAYGYISIW